MADEIKAQLELLYRAGKQTFPHRAMALNSALDGIADVHEMWREPTHRSGSPTALVKAMDINATVHALMRRAVLSWQDAAHATVAIADDFTATDADAAAAASTVGFDLDTAPMPDLPTPRGLDGATP